MVRLRVTSSPPVLWSPNLIHPPRTALSGSDQMALNIFWAIPKQLLFLLIPRASPAALVFLQKLRALGTTREALSSRRPVTQKHHPRCREILSTAFVTATRTHVLLHELRCIVAA